MCRASVDANASAAVPPRAAGATRNARHLHVASRRETTTYGFRTSRNASAFSFGTHHATYAFLSAFAIRALRVLASSFPPDVYASSAACRAAPSAPISSATHGPGSLAARLTRENVHCSRPQRSGREGPYAASVPGPSALGTSRTSSSTRSTDAPVASTT